MLMKCQSLLLSEEKDQYKAAVSWETEPQKTNNNSVW